MSGYWTRDPVTTDPVRLRRCDLCGALETCVGVDSIPVEHPRSTQVLEVPLCRACEGDYDLAQALVADRLGEPVAEPHSEPMEPDAAEARIERERARWEASA